MGCHRPLQNLTSTSQVIEMYLELGSEGVSDSTYDIVQCVSRVWNGFN